MPDVERHEAAVAADDGTDANGPRLAGASELDNELPIKEFAVSTPARGAFGVKVVDMPPPRLGRIELRVLP